MKTKVNILNKNDLRIDYFRSGGNGGQHQNKTSSGCRITHEASGAVGEARDSKHQHINKQEAFKRMCATPRFKIWLEIQVRGLDWVENQLGKQNLLIEHRKNNEWIEWKSIAM